MLSKNVAWPYFYSFIDEVFSDEGTSEPLYHYFFLLADAMRVMMNWLWPACTISNSTFWPGVTPFSSALSLTWKSMVIAGQLRPAIGPWARLTLPAFASTPLTVPPPLWAFSVVALLAPDFIPGVSFISAAWSGKAASTSNAM